MNNPKAVLNVREKGFTLIEMVISLTIFLVAVAAIYGVAKVAGLQKNTVSTRVDQLRSARIALEYIRRDAINAGLGYHRTGGNMPDNVGNALFGIKTDADAERDLMTSILAGNEINTNSLNFGSKTDVAAFVSRDLTFNNGLLVNYSGAAAAGNKVQVTVPNVTVNSVTTPGTQNCRTYDLYLFESSTGTTQVVGVATAVPNGTTIELDSGTPDPLGINQSAVGAPDSRSLLVTTSGGGTIKKVNLISYSVTNEGVLIRKTYGNQSDKPLGEQIETRELVYNVSDFQIKYFMEDGTTVDDPSNENNGRTNQIKMNSVVQLQVSITIAADQSNGSSQASAPIVIKEFISTKNLRYEAS